MQARWRMFGNVLFCLFLVFGIVTPPRAEGVTSSAGETFSVSGTPLRLAVGTFDPVKETVPGQVPASLAAVPTEGAGYYLVQFSGPIATSDIDALEAAGAEVFDYIPDFAFIVKMDNAGRAAVEEMRNVRWVGDYQPAYRLTPDLLTQAAATGVSSNDNQLTDLSGKTSGRVTTRDNEPLTLVVSIFHGELLSPIKSHIESLGGIILDESQTEWKSKLKIVLPTASLAEVAAIPGVRWIEPAPQWELANDVADNVMGVREVWDTEGLYGAGQTVAVCDTGLDQGSTVPASLHDDFENGSGSSRVIALYDRVGDGPSDVNSGHGTHVAGSVLGNGDLSGATPGTHTYPESARMGMAPEASLVFQAVENNTTGALSGIPLDLNTLFAQAASGGADLHTNSWGSDVSGMYTTDSEDVDEYIWTHKDFAIFFSAANAGIDNNADGVIDLYSMGSPATAKNCITVGASENNRPSISTTWGDGWPTDFSANPVRDDLMADDIAGLAAFSSRGPVLDGRYKPDIVAPGTWIASTKSSATSSTGWGAINSYYMYMGGTSMSTPLTAGAAAIVRQYYTDVKGHTPSAALVKATMVNGATDMYPGQYGTGTTQEIASTRPTNIAGWGRVNVEDSIFPTTPRTMNYFDETSGLTTGSSAVYNYTITASGEPFEVTLAWSDYPGSPVAAGGLVNDLDLTITGPGGTTYYPNNANQRGASQHLAYDSSYATTYFYWSAGNRVAVRFTPTQYPAKLQTGSFYLASFSYPETFNWYVYAGNNTSGPTSVLASGSSTIRAQGWHTIDFSSAGVTLASGDFFLAIEMPDSDLVWFADDSSPHSRSWDYDGASWGVSPDEDYLFHATVSSPDLTTQHDRVNNLVGIDIPNPATGVYTVTVTGYNVPHGPQPYALVASGVFTTANTAPQFTTIGDQALRPGESRNDAVDLWAYASDSQDLDAAMIFAIINSPPVGAGITLDSNRYIDITPTLEYIGTVPVQVQVTDTGGLSDTATFDVIFAETNTIYLPLILRRWPPIPAVPVLNAISNTDGDGNYTVSWTSADLAQTYVLEEATNAAFLGPITRYEGPGTSWSASEKTIGTYYYRVKAQNTWGDSGWSNIQQVRVDVGWVIILSDGFEGAFPGGTWTVRDNDPDSGRYYWWKRDCRPHSGNYSAWSAGGGDSTISCGYNYRNDMYAWMIYGPFSLADATAAELIFDWWSDTEYGYDAFFWAASADGNNYYGTLVTGYWASWTTGQRLDLSAVPTLGNLLGRNQVWIAFGFGSDYSNTDRGSFVDNVVLRKRTTGIASTSQNLPSVQRVLQPNQTMDFGEWRLDQPNIWGLLQETHCPSSLCIPKTPIEDAR